MVDNKSRFKAVGLLRSVLKDEMTPQEAMHKWPEANDRDLDVALHILQHFENDDDIRKKDAKYAAWQLNEIENMISKLQGDN